MNALKTTWHHLRRTPFQSLTAISIFSISYFIISTFILVSSGMAAVLNYFETKPEITIFLKDGLDRATIENIQNELVHYPSVKEIKFISKEKALSIYRQQNKDNPLLTEMVTASILPASFEISVSDPKILDQIADNFSTKTTVVDEIIYQKDLISSLLKWTGYIRRFGISAITIVSLTTLLTIFTIIGLKVSNRKDEIKITRLLGASPFYVKKPFLLEGLTYGLVGSSLGCLTSFSLAFYFAPNLNTFFQPVQFVGADPSFYFLTATICLFSGMMFGYFTSWLSVKRYIKF